MWFAPQVPGRKSKADLGAFNEFLKHKNAPKAAQAAEKPPGSLIAGELSIRVVTAVVSSVRCLQ